MRDVAIQRNRGAAFYVASRRSFVCMRERIVFPFPLWSLTFIVVAIFHQHCTDAHGPRSSSSRSSRTRFISYFAKMRILHCEPFLSLSFPISRTALRPIPMAVLHSRCSFISSPRGSLLATARGVPWLPWLPSPSRSTAAHDTRTWYVTTEAKKKAQSARLAAKLTALRRRSTRFFRRRALRVASGRGWKTCREDTRVSLYLKKKRKRKIVEKQ